MKRTQAGLVALAGAIALCIPASASAAGCSARSARGTAALVELYTSEGCNSCPPADQWLSTLKGGAAPARVVPLALHVDYWDYIGWKDPYALPAFARRQREAAAIARARVVYTPQVMLHGRDFRGWRGGAFEAAVKGINAREAPARIALEMAGGAPGALELAVEAEVPDAGRAKDAALYVAAYQSGLSSRVTAGENDGRTLVHDFVVRAWSGPIAFGRATRIERRVRLALPAGADPAKGGAAAFVQSTRTGEVLQALMLPACAG